MKYFPMLICFAPLLAACSSGPSTEEVLQSHGYSQVYVAGYHSGCESGRHAGGDLFAKRVRDTGAYNSGGDYKTGWDYGFLTCKQQEIQELEMAAAIGVAAAIGSSSSNHGADGIDARKALNGVDTSDIRAAGW